MPRKYHPRIIYDPDDIYAYHNRFQLNSLTRWVKTSPLRKNMPEGLTSLQAKWWCAHPLAYRQPFVPKDTPEKLAHRKANPKSRRKSYTGSKHQKKQKHQPPPGAEDLHCTNIRAKYQPRWDGRRGPSLDHPRRCTAFNRRTGKKCGNMSNVGYNVCCYHLGRHSRYDGSKIHEEKAYSGMPEILSKQTRSILEEFVETQTGINPNEQLSVLTELALVRYPCNRSVEDYSQAIELEALAKEQLREDPSNEDLQKLHAKSKSAMFAAGQAMTARVQDVTKIADAAAKINNATKDTLSIHNLHFMVRQIVAILYEELGDENVELIERINNAIKKEITVLVDKPTGTDLTPSADARLMDSSVPRDPEEDSVFDMSVVDASVKKDKPEDE